MNVQDIIAEFKKATSDEVVGQLVNMSFDMAFPDDITNIDFASSEELTDEEHVAGYAKMMATRRAAFEKAGEPLPEKTSVSALMARGEKGGYLIAMSTQSEISKVALYLAGLLLTARVSELREGTFGAEVSE